MNEPSLRKAARDMNHDLYRRLGKRTLDVVLSSAALIALFPLLAVLALLVRWRLGSPVLFRQWRPGRGGRPFLLYKFRTMTDARDACGRRLDDSRRLTRFGRFLRASSLDELPELWNVLRGEMSLIGPRPLLAQYLERYTPEQARRHEVRPGITGWAQINGRNALDWESRLALDVWYVDNVGLRLDLAIFVCTLWKVVARDGVSAAGHATMPEFRGTRTISGVGVRSGGVIVIGAGGHAKVVVSTLRAAGRRVDAVFDDDESRWGSDVLGAPVTGPIAALKVEAAPGAELEAMIAIGDNAVRRRLAEQHDLKWIAAVHPRSVVDATVAVSAGTLVCAGAVVQPDAVLGEHTIVNTGATVDHDCRVGPFCHVAPGVHLAGNVHVGEGTLLGIGSSAIPGVNIGAECIVGAGAVVVADLPDGVLAVGCPASVARKTCERVERAA